jgi:hypothetical protein
MAPPEDDLPVREEGGAASFELRVTTRASRTGIADVRGGQLRVRITAAPVDGAANDALVALLADALDVPKYAVRIVRGERSRTKTVRVEGIGTNTRQARAVTPAPGTRARKRLRYGKMPRCS